MVEQSAPMDKQQGADTVRLHWAIRLRKRLLIPGSWRWNAWVRDITARLERPIHFDGKDRTDG